MLKTTGITMNHIYSKPLALALAVLLGACSSMPKSTSLLDQTRNEYATAQASTQVGTFAPLELKQAGQALDQANAAAARDAAAGTIDQLATVARQKIAAAHAVAKRAEAEGAGRPSPLGGDQSAPQQADAAREAQARGAQLDAQMADLAARKTGRGMVVTLDDALFGPAPAHLTPDGMRAVQKLADVLAQDPQRPLMVEAFTDNTGGSAQTQQLSELRANAVRAALVGLGVAPARIATRGYGEAHPVGPNDSALNRQHNRRVEIVLSNDSAKIAPR
jgi:outer membrane protein OmpA-like peptidoglycan-associated protein